jgi:hypothetical protein
MANTTFKFFTDHMGGTSVAKYIGRKGEVFYNPDHGAL